MVWQEGGRVGQGRGDAGDGPPGESGGGGGGEDFGDDRCHLGYAEVATEAGGGVQAGAGRHGPAVPDPHPPGVRVLLSSWLCPFPEEGAAGGGPLPLEGVERCIRPVRFDGCEPQA